MNYLSFDVKLASVVQVFFPNAALILAKISNKIPDRFPIHVNRHGFVNTIMLMSSSHATILAPVPWHVATGNLFSGVAKSTTIIIVNKVTTTNTAYTDFQVVYLQNRLTDPHQIFVVLSNGQWPHGDHG
jgi:hypothetical protein